MLRLQPNFPPLITFIFWSWWTLYGVANSDPQTNLIHYACTPNDNILSNISIFNHNANATFRDIREQIGSQNKRFATAHQANDAENPVFTLFQCRNYLPIRDCVTCFDVAAKQTRNCSAGAHGAQVIYDGCFLRYDTSSGFFGETTSLLNAASCGNQTTREPITFTSVVQQVLKNLQTATPKINGFSAATKMQLPNNSTSIYAFAQCIETITQSGCLQCLNIGYNNMLTCLPNSDGGKAYANGCFMRYSTTSFFPDNQTINITPLVKRGSSNKGAIIGGVIGGVTLVLILFALFAWIRQPKSYKGDITRLCKMTGLVAYNYKDLKAATRNFSEENKLGEGGFGAVYKGTLQTGKVVAVKKLTLQHSKRMEEDFESEVKLISNVCHPNLVQLLGCCSEGHVRILVYEYMKNNSLNIFLFGEKKGYFNWKQRYNVILGTARGLAYLHEEFHVHIIHRDIKTSNILLDDDLQPRIADFGLARLLPEDKSHLTTKFAGTLGYIAPEYAVHGQLSEKVDIYSYGIVILEIISGKKSEAIKVDGDTESDLLLQKAWRLYERGMHKELVDNTLDPNDYDAEEVKKIIEIGLLCVQPFADLRPSMSEVIDLLQSKGLLENMRPIMPAFIEINYM